jgi:hypothetical protein
VSREGQARARAPRFSWTSEFELGARPEVVTRRGFSLSPGLDHTPPRAEGRVATTTTMTTATFAAGGALATPVRASAARRVPRAAIVSREGACPAGRSRSTGGNNDSAGIGRSRVASLARARLSATSASRFASIERRGSSAGRDGPARGSIAAARAAAEDAPATSVEDGGGPPDGGDDAGSGGGGGGDGDDQSRGDGDEEEEPEEMRTLDEVRPADPPPPPPPGPPPPPSPPPPPGSSPIPDPLPPDAAPPRAHPETRFHSRRARGPRPAFPHPQP